MKKSKGITPINFKKLNSAEFASVHEGTILNLQEAGIDKLGVSPELFDSYRANDLLFRDVIANSRTSDETALIAETKGYCDDALRYLFDIFKRGRLSPVVSDRAAYTSLYNLTSPARGIMRLPLRQQVARMQALLFDLAKEDAAQLIAQLGLTEEIEATGEAVRKLAALIGSRAERQVEQGRITAKPMRPKLVDQYDLIMTAAFANSVLNPTPESDAFIARQNKLIADTNTLYNIRMGLLHHYKREAKAAREAAAASAAPAESAD